MLKILCPGGFTWLNKGDAALVISMLAELRRKFPDANYTVLSDTPDLDSMMYEEEALPIPFEPRGTSDRIIMRLYDQFIGWRFKNKWLKLAGLRRRRRRWSFVPFTPYLELWLQLFQASFLLRFFGERALFLFRANYRDTYRRFLEADLVVFVPGGYFMAPHRNHLHWLRHIYCLSLAKSLNKQVVFFAVSIGPFVGNLNRWLARRYLDKADLIVLREELSKKLLTDLGVTRPTIAVTTDVAFLLPNAKTERILKICESLQNNTSITAGMSVRPYDFPADPQAQQKTTEYPITLAKAIDHLVDVHDATVILVPQVSAPGFNDIDFSRNVLRHVRNIDRVHIIDEDLTPGELKWLYSRTDIFVGVRMHANIFALGNCVPIVAIAYEPKTVGIMHTLGLSDYALEIGTLTEEALTLKIDKLILNRQTIVSHLNMKQDQIRQLASMTADVIYDYFYPADKN